MFLPTDRSVQFPNRYQLAPVSGTDNIADLTPAPGEVSDPGTLWNRQAARQMQADLRTLPIAPGYSVSAGDVVDVDDGQVVKTVTGQANVENTIISSSTSDCAVVRLNDQYSVAVFVASGATGGNTYLLNNQNGEISGSSPVLSGSPISNVSLARLSDTQFVVFYKPSGSALVYKIGTVSGTNISFSEQDHAGASSNMTACAALAINDELLFTVETYSGSIFAYAFQPGQGTGTQYALGVYNASNLSATLLPDDSSGNHRVCVCFSDGNDGNKGKAVIATIDSANTVTWGTVVTFDESSSDAISCAENAGIVLVSYVSGSSTNVVALSISGTSISVSDKLSGVYASDAEDTSICAVGSSFVLSLQSGGYCFAIQYSNGKISSGARYSFNGDSQAKYPSAAPVSPSQFIVAYADAGNSSYGTTTILEVMGTQIAGSFTDESSTAIALQSGTAGQSIECIFSGTTNAAWVTEGQVIDSPGAYGVGIMDGILQVWSKERPGQVVTGSYVGTGTYGSSNPVTISVKNAKVLVITYDSYTATTDNPTLVVLIRPSTTYKPINNDSLIYPGTISWGDESVSFYSNTAAWQMNVSSKKYTYFAICN